MNTPSIPETIVENIAKRFVSTPPVVTEKMDGSLGIFYRLGDDWGIATRGSFTSPQALWATKWYQQKVAEGVLRPFSGGEWTPLFEIVYKENQIVVSYDFEGLVLIGAVNKFEGSECQYLSAFGSMRGFKGDLVVKDYGRVEFGNKFENKLPQSEKNREGYVLTFHLDYGSPLKVKVKFEEYLQMHRIVTGLNHPRRLWEVVSKGADLDLRGELPDHFKQWLKGWQEAFTADYDRLYRHAKALYDTRPVEPSNDQRALRKRQAEYIRKELDLYTDAAFASKVQTVFFAMLLGDKDSVNELIWYLIKPRGDDRSFRTDGE